MIRVERTEAPFLLQTRLDRAAAQMQRIGAALPPRFDFDPAPWLDARPALAEMFHHKCAYCESPLADALTQSGVEHFRPTQGAMDLKKRVDRHHYYWLAYEWTNLYLVCGNCNVNKKTLFPVEGKRALLGRSVSAERPLLIDPCSDHPEAHFYYYRDGVVGPGSHRGEITIKCLGLNRPDLVEARGQAAEQVWHALQIAGEPVSDALIGPSLPYAAIRRSVVRQWQVQQTQGRLKPRRKRAKTASRKQATKRRVSTAKRTPEQDSSSSRRQTIVTPVNVRQSGFVRKIDIRNFRAIRRLDSLPVNAAARSERTEETPAGWMMLLGENAAGKSSVLQAVALALAGKSALAAIPTTQLDSLINNNANAATVRIEVSADPYVIELQLQRGRRPKFLKGGEGHAGLVLGYGATRLIGHTVAKKSSGVSDDEKRISNLFDPLAPLTPAEKWLLALYRRSPDAFNAVGDTVRTLLRLEARKPLRVKGNRVLIATDLGPVRPHQLSSGFQSIFSLGIDIMQASAQHTHDKRYISGVVLLDEIDAHLHPRWKMEVVETLRTAFPYVQFIASTHEPLCLRGTKKNEIVLMRRDENGVIEAVTDLPSPEQMRVDQLLTSALFGLHTTLDPKLEKEFREYYALLGKDKLNSKERARLDALRKPLGRVGVLGYTRRDQLVYQFIDKYLANEQRLPPEELKPRLARTKRRVLDLWERAEAWTEKERA